MKMRLFILPLIAAVCLLAGPRSASAWSNNNYGNNFNWGGVSGLFNNWTSYSNNYNSRDCFGQKDLDDYLKKCNKDWDRYNCDNDDYFSFCKDGKEQYQVKACDLSKYICKDQYNWFGKIDCFKVGKKGSNKYWKFDCIKYNPCKPRDCKPTPPDCKTVPTPAAASAGMALIGLLALGRNFRKRQAA